MYSLEYRDEGVYFRVPPSSSDLDKLDEKQIIQHLRRKKIEGLLVNIVFQALRQNEGKEVYIAPPQAEVMLDEELIVRISNDQMQAFATLLPPENGKRLTEHEILRILEEHKVTYGIDRNVVTEIIEQKLYEEERIVAQGKPQENGQDAKLEFHVQLNKKAAPHISDNGSVNYHLLDMIENVQKGQLLVSMTPPTPGIPGITVLCNPVSPKPGKTLNMPKGKNVELSDDGLKILALIEGKVEMIDKKVHVFGVHDVKDSVDHSTGNINFVGNVVINGNVMAGFEVRAGGFIEVKGVVEGAFLFASGNIVLRRGIQGMGKGTIVAGGNVIARFIESGHVAAKGDVIAEAIMHSNVSCGGKIKLAGKKGLIVGGKLHAAGGISAFTIGSPMATFTELEVGINPEIREKYDSLKKELESIENEIKKSDQILMLLGKMEMTSPLPVDKQLLKLKVTKTRNASIAIIDQTRAKIQELEEILLSTAGSKVCVSKIIYPGVSVIIGTSSMRLKEVHQYATFKREYGEIRITPYQPL